MLAVNFFFSRFLPLLIARKPFKTGRFTKFSGRLRIRTTISSMRRITVDIKFTKKSLKIWQFRLFVLSSHSKSHLFFVAGRCFCVVAEGEELGSFVSLTTLKTLSLLHFQENALAVEEIEEQPAGGDIRQARNHAADIGGTQCDQSAREELGCLAEVYYPLRHIYRNGIQSYDAEKQCPQPVTPHIYNIVE